MSNNAYDVNHPLAVKLWSRKLFQESISQAWVSKFMGNDTNSLIQIKNELNKSPGDQITIGLRMLLTGAGIQGDGLLEGDEEALTTAHCSVLVDQLRHAVRSSGKMSEQRVPFSMREEARLGLQDWWADRLDTAFFNQICGYSAAKDTRYTGNQAALDPDKDHIMRAGNKENDEDIDEKQTFKLEHIDMAVENAKTSNPLIRPLRINGQDKYVMFLHPYQVTDLRTQLDKSSWMEIQKAALAGGQISKNPIYTGSLGEYNGVILHEAHRVTKGVHSKTKKSVENVRRAVLCGAQSAVMAFGRGASEKKMNWIEETFDYNNQFGVSAGMIFGLKKTRFKDKDFGTVVISTYAESH